ncbi:hypothetical protein M8C17_17820 [Micromonospora sp. RHAY321]|uniref:hypothetical protein n=1 Tax=unclassified Micromonospora TaxID=2617518 RepID=UPI00207D199C|nr:hypothetical protein [Micromonospora sp. RHAY321]MCO1597016.1 hypothetical protein [Micromonospora sp. RHAY321]
MEEGLADIESELLDLSTVDVASLRSVDLTGMTAAISRVRAIIADTGGSISGYNGSSPSRRRPTGPDSEEHGV